MYFKFAGMKLLMAQHWCTDTHLLPLCTQPECIGLCLRIYRWHSHGECKNPFNCRCYHECPMREDGNDRNHDISPPTLNPPTPVLP